MPLILAYPPLEGHTDRIWTLAWNPAGTILASSGADKSIRLWAQSNASDKSWSCVAVLADTHNKSIRRLSWSPCGIYLASASFDSTVCIWKRNATDGSWLTIVNLEGHESEVKSVAWSSDGNYLASCGRDKTVWIWERASKDGESDDLSNDELDSAAEWDCSDVKNDHGRDVKHIIWHPHHNILVSCSYDDTVKLFHKPGDDWTCFQTLSSHGSTVWSADFSASGEYLVTCSDDKTVRVWRNYSHNKLPIVESNSWKCVSVIQGYHSRSIYDVSWNKFTELFVSASGDNSLVIYSRNQDKCTPDDEDLFTCICRQDEAHSCDVNCVAWNPNAPDLLASGSDDRKIKLWRYTSDDKGMQPLPIIDQLLKELSSASLAEHLIDDPNSKTTNSDSSQDNKLTIKVADFPNLLNLTKTLQTLQNEISRNQDRIMLKKLLDQEEDILDYSQALLISGLKFDQQPIGTVLESFFIDISNDRGEIIHQIKILIDGERDFSLNLPKRSVKIIAVANELFLIEKTGDLYKILNDGKSQFLLGHLFTLSDVQFVTNKTGDKIRYIITADRDEKLRISNYPDTFDIERYCFGHKHFIRCIVLLKNGKFASIDHANEVSIWNLEKLKESSNEPLTPEKTFSFDGCAKKRIRTQ